MKHWFDFALVKTGAANNAIAVLLYVAISFKYCCSSFKLSLNIAFVKYTRGLSISIWITSCAINTDSCNNVSRTGILVPINGTWHVGGRYLWNCLSYFWPSTNKNLFVAATYFMFCNLIIQEKEGINRALTRTKKVLTNQVAPQA